VKFFNIYLRIDLSGVISHHIYFFKDKSYIFTTYVKICLISLSTNQNLWFHFLMMSMINISMPRLSLDLSLTTKLNY